MADKELDILVNVVRLREKMRAGGDDPETCLRIGRLFEDLDESQVAAAWYVRGSRAAKSRFAPGQDTLGYADGVLRPFTLALWAVGIAPDYLPARQQLAEACKQEGVELDWALAYAARKREAKALERELQTDDAKGSARLRLAAFWLEKGDSASAVDWYMRAARHAETNGELQAAFEALSEASMLKDYKKLQRELLRVGALLKKAR